MREIDTLVANSAILTNALSLGAGIVAGVTVVKPTEEAYPLETIASILAKRIAANLTGANHVK